MPSILPSFIRSGLRSGWRWLSWLLRWRRFMGNSRRAGAFLKNCRIVWDDFWASVKRSVKPSTAGPNRLPDETGEPCPPLSSPSSWARGGVPTLSGWTTTARWPGALVACWRGAWWRPGRNHSPSLLRDGSSGGDHSSLSSLTAFVMIRMSSWVWRCVKMVAKGRGQSEPDNSYSEAAMERLPSISPSHPPNKIMSLTATEGRWSSWVKRTGECSLCGDGEACGNWANVGSLVTSCLNPLRCCFFPHRSLGGVSLWKESYPQPQKSETETLAMRAVSPAEISPSMTHAQRDCHQHAGETCTSYNDGTAFATMPCGNWLFCEAPLDRRRMAAGDRPDRCKRSNPAAEAFQWRI